MRLKLTLRWSETPLGTPGAWLLPGEDPRAWLAELCRWGLAQASVRLLPIMRRDLAVPAVGLLVLPPRGTTPTHPGAGVPYRLLAERLYLPLDARLEPEVTERELAALLPGSDSLCVWHPAAGLLAYGPDELSRVEDLLAPPREHGSEWDRALPGPASNRRLVSIAPSMSLSLEQVLADARGDIGSQAGQPGELPSRSEEGDWVRNMKEGLAAGAARFVEWATRPGESPGGRPPGAPNRDLAGNTPGWLDALRNWAARQQQAWSENLAAARNRELLRLLELLQKRPDEGLRYALPLAGDATRGLAPPGTSLGPRNVDFSLSGLGRSQAADIWDIEERYRRELTERYRALANREIALGRHRRAAYIFAELLGDLRSAASTLEDGKHYREAAALYQERLESDRDAARCLCRGGLWVEAIAIYEKLGEHEQVGDLYEQIGDTERARQAWLAAVEGRRALHDALGAARLLEGKLLDHDAAYRELVSAWPAGAQAEACLERAFELLGARGRHEEARRQIAALPETVAGWGSGAARMLVERLASVAVRYPDAESRRAAADQTRVVAAPWLEGAALDEVSRLTAALRNLAEGDRLLARDCQRFLESRQRKSTLGSPVPRPNREMFLLRQFQLEGLRELRSVVASGKSYFAAGRNQESCLVFVRGQWDGQHRKVVDTRRIAGPPLDVLLAVCQRPPVLYAHPLTVRLAPLEFEFADPPVEYGDILRITSHSAFDPQTVAIAAEGGRLVSVYAGKDRDMAIVNTFLIPEGKLASSRTIVPQTSEDPFEVSDPISAPLPILLRGDTLFLGFGRWLAIDHGGRLEWIEFGSPIRSIVGSRTHTRDRIAVMLEHGGALLWGERESSPRGEIGSDLHEARAAFTDGGWLVAASASEIQVYHNSHGARVGRMTWLISAPGPGEEVVAVLPTDQPNEVAVATASGAIRVYRLPKP